jgi:phosphoserine phosphatase
VKVFDFDNTIYRGESSIDLALYMMKNNNKIIRFVPSIFANLVKYKLCLIGMEEMESIINDFCSSVMGNKDEIPAIIEGFWRTHAGRLDARILKRIRPEDIIITAGPDVLIEGIKERLGTDHIIASKIDPDTGKIIYLNYKDNKVKRYKELYGGRPIDALYTDSYNDQALMDISKKVYLVKRKGIRKVKG